jgi:ElaB/YqjD/DUF883 family membrane-anchored ribosome-binding protein
MAMTRGNAARRKTAAKSRRKTSSKTSSRRTRRARPRNALVRARDAMTHAMRPDISDMQAEVSQLMSDLEDRVARLNSLSRRGAGHAVEGVNNFVHNALSSVTDHVRGNLRTVGDDATKFGQQALREITSQVDKRPILTLAIAAGIGFVAGLSRRQD